MNKNKILSARFYGFAKYTRIIAAIALLLYVIFAAINTGEGTMVLFTYGLLMLAIIGSLQSIFLLILAKYFENKS